MRDSLGRRRRRRRSSSTSRPSAPGRRPGAQRLPLPALRGPSPVGASPTGRGSTASSASPTSSTAPTTSCRRRRATAVVSVYDCWFLRHPALASRDVHRAGRGPAPGHRARRHRPRQLGVDGRRRSPICSPALESRRSRWPRCRSPSRRRRPAGRRRSSAARSSPRSARSSDARTCRCSSRRSACWHPSTTRSCSCSPAPTATTGRPSTRRSIGSTRPPPSGCVMTGRVDEAARSWLLRHAAVLAYPSLDEGFGFPLLDAMQVGTADRRQQPRQHPGGVRCSGSAVRRATTSIALADQPRHRGVRRRRSRATARRRGRRNSTRSRGRGARPIWPRSIDASAPMRRRPMIAVAVRRRRRRTIPRGTRPRSSTPSTPSPSSTPATTPCCTGCRISPDLDTVTYTLAEAIDPERGWGLADESWRAMEALQRYATGPSRRARRPRRPGSTSATATWPPTSTAPPGSPRAPRSPRSPPRSAAAWGVRQRLVPMTDDRFRTMVTLADAATSRSRSTSSQFRHGVPVSAVRFDGADDARAVARRSTMSLTDRRCVVIAPSNPIVSIGPIRALPERRRAPRRTARSRGRHLADRRRRCAEGPRRPHAQSSSGTSLRSSVSPGCTRRSPRTLVIDPVDAHLADAVEAEGMRAVITPSVMNSSTDRRRARQELVARSSGQLISAELSAARRRRSVHGAHARWIRARVGDSANREMSFGRRGAAIGSSALGPGHHRPQVADRRADSRADVDDQSAAAWSRLGRARRRHRRRRGSRAV